MVNLGVMPRSALGYRGAQPHHLTGVSIWLARRFD
jgi:hypothetical protein